MIRLGEKNPLYLLKRKHMKGLKKWDIFRKIKNFKYKPNCGKKANIIRSSKGSQIHD